MSSTRKVPTAAKKPGRPMHQDLAAALAEREVELAEARRQQAATAEILRVISQTPTDAQPVFERIVVTAARALRCDMAVMLVRDGDVYVHTAAATSKGLVADFAPERFPIDPNVNFPSRAFLAKTMLHLPDWSQIDLPKHERWIHETFGITSALYWPLLRGDECIGVLVFAGTRRNSFGLGEIAHAESFRDQALIAMENARLFSETREALERQTATADILKVIASSPSDVRPVFKAIAASANRLLGGFSTTVIRFVGDALHLVAFTPTNVVADEALQAAFPRPIAQFPPFMLVRDGETQQFVDTEAEKGVPPIIQELARLRGYRSMLFTPLMSDDDAIGMISVTREEPGAFAADDVQLLQTFADQAVIAIKNVGLFNETQEALQQQKVTADVLKVINRSAFDLDPVFDALLASAVSLVGGTGGTICVRDGDVFRYRAVAEGRDSAIWRYISEHPATPGRASVAGRVLLSGKPETICDTLSDGELKSPLHSLTGARSVVGVPLLRDDRVEGALMVARAEAGAFDSRQIDVLQTFADQAVIAIENVRLFRETQEALRQQTATSDILKVIASSPNDLQPVLDIIVETACRLCNAYDAVVLLREGDQLRIVSHHGPIPITFASQQISRGWASGRAVIEGRAIHIDDIAEHADEYPVAAALASRGMAAGSGKMLWRANLVVPLMREGEAIGVIGLRRAEAVPFSEAQTELLKTFSDQAVIAIENARLFDEVQAKTRDLQESLQQQTATADVLKVISRSAFDLPAVLRTLVESAAKLCDADKATITREINGVYYRAETYGFSDEFMNQIRNIPVAPERGSITGLAMLKGKAVQVEDVETDPEYWPKNFAKPGELHTGLGIPMMRNGAPIGVLALMRTQIRPFNEKQIALVQTFADQAAIAIENARLFDEVQAKTRDLQESLEQQTASAEILRVISSSPTDVQPVFDAIAHSAAVLCEATNGTVFRLRDGVIHLVGHYSLSQAQLASVQDSFPAPLDRGTASGRAILERGVVHILDIAADREYSAPSLVKTGLRSVLSVPMLRNGEPIGSINVSRDAVRPFSERQIELLKTFADQAVIAINNVGLFNETREALEQQKATADVLKVISRSAFNLDAVLQTLTHSARSLSGAASVDVEMLDGDFLRIRAQSGCDPELVKYIEEHPPRRGAESVAGRVLMTGEAVHIPDVLADSDYDFGEGPQIGNYRALLGAPLIRDGKVDGVFTLMRPEPGAFTSRQIELVQTFADQAVIAIENARLFEEVQARTRDLSEALEQQTATAEVLKVISRSAFDLNLATSTILEAAAKLCRAPLATLHLRDGEVCRLVTQFGLPEAFERQARESPIPVRYPLHSRRPARAGDIAHFSDAWNDPDYLYKTTAKLGGYRAIVVIPVMRQDELVGIFSLGRPEPEPFTPSQIKLVQTFADQAAIAIENARLFDEVRARTEDLSEALQQQTATANVLKVISRSAFDLQAVLTTLAESARDLCGASFVTLSLREGDAMRLGAESGCTPEIIQFMGAHPIRAGRETFTGRVMLSGEAVHLPDVLADPEYDFGEGPRIGNYRALLAAPLLREGRVEGVFALARPKPEPFTARQIEMVRAFADQAVIAIENSRLFEEVQARTRELAASLDDLRKAQDRLIQSEKLASLGQLTAGIAHEIKNPLNFINNYSALSRELVDELGEAIKGGAAGEATDGEADELIGAIGGNLDKIVQHGKRADSIVKNMLLHSREGSGERSMTNVNAMVEEALNLAYHGARAEKPGFNVTIVKSLDPNAGAAEVYAQEMTRVLLNLISNGFYATSKRKQGAGDDAYEPTISASTRDLGSKVEIAIRDNGTGIPDEVKAKMFNPFFTTKPAGEGTGLGLSLSHDIVVKQHGGAIEVSTEPDAFTEFSIVLPRGAAQI